MLVEDSLTKGTCSSCLPLCKMDSRTAASRAVELPCSAGGPPSRPRWLFVVEVGSKASERASPPQLKVCHHLASPPLLALVPDCTVAKPASCSSQRQIPSLDELVLNHINLTQREE